MKPILLYLILVGLPVLGIFGLLRAGQKLSAPISLFGTWNAQLNVESSPRNTQHSTLNFQHSMSVRPIRTLCRLTPSMTCSMRIRRGRRLRSRPQMRRV